MKHLVIPRFFPCRRHVLFGLSAGLLAAAGAFAAPEDFIVTVDDDSVNAGDGVVSLREAITTANATATPTIITFDAAVFAAPGPYTIQLESALPALVRDITITGPGTNVLTVRGEGGGDPYRIFNINAGHTVSISGLTISNGLAAGANGVDGVSPVVPTAGTVGQGGGIFNAGSLTLTDCVLSGNTAQGGSGGGGQPNTSQTAAVGANGQGGGIYSTGLALTIVRCTFSGNSALGGNGGPGGSIQFGGGGSGSGGNAADAAGGAIYLVGAGTHSIVNSTFAGNIANGGQGGSGGSTNFTSGFMQPGGTGGDAAGGAIYSTQPLSLISCTVTQGAANAGGGGLQGNFTPNTPGDAFGGGLDAVGLISIGSSLVAGNTVTNPDAGLAQGPDVFGSFSSQNFNLVGALDANTTGFIGAADQSGTIASPLDAKLDPLGAQNNGGPTTTVRLRKGSPAVDKGKDLGPLGTDQRGNTRPTDLADGTYPEAPGGDASDIGAYEAQSLPNDAPTTTNQGFAGAVGTPFSGVQLTGSDGDTDTLTYSLDTGTMPDGLTLNSDGTITGTPTAASQTVVTFLVNDGMADSAPRNLSLNIAESSSLVVTTDIDNSTIYDGLTSLREAVNFAAIDVGNTPVTFDATFFATPKTITLSSGLFISSDLDINGPGAGVTVSGGNTTGIFQIYAGIVNLKDLTIANGFSNAFGAGGGLLLSSFGTPPVVTLSNCTLRDNGGNDSQGGAIVNFAATLTLSNCTLTGNHADFVNNFSSAGGAIYQNGGALTLHNCTLSGNHSNGGLGGAIAIDGGTFTLGNSIVAGNTATTGPDISGPVVSQGYNLIGNSAGATITGTTTGNQLGVASGLDPAGLANNGGPTQTIALLTGSLAIDKGKALGAATTDQRGEARPSDFLGTVNAPGGDGSDIGAFEVQFPALYVQWASSKGLTGANDGFTDNPDGDGETNIEEFAFDGDPLSAVNDGKRRLAVSTLPTLSGDYLHYTFPVLDGANFTWDGTAMHLWAMLDDSHIYRVRGSFDLVAPLDELVSEVDPAVFGPPDLPNLTPGWSYRTIRFNTPLTSPDRAFIILDVVTP